VAEKTIYRGSFWSIIKFKVLIQFDASETRNPASYNENEETTMELMLKMLVILALVFIVFSLFQGMYYLSKDDGEQDRTRVVRSLTVRIVLSFVLFSMLLVGYYFGFLQPHGL